MKKLRLMPSLREKKRYVAFEVLHGPKGYGAVSGAVSASCLDLLGRVGMAEAGIMLIENCYNSHDGTGILRVHSGNVDELKSALALIKAVGNEPAIVRSLGVSGILDKARKRFIAA